MGNWSRWALSLAVVFGWGCETPAEPKTEVAPTASTVTASASPSAAAAPTSSASTANFPKRTKRTETGWMLIKYGGAPLGLATLPPDGKAKLEIIGDNAEAAQTLEEVWGKISQPDGIGLDFHMPSPDGGRGDNATMLVSPEHVDWVYAAQEELKKKDFDAGEVPAFDEKTPPATIKQLKVARSGEAVGTLDFTKTPPVLTLETEKADGDFMKSHWEQAQKRDKLVVRYHMADGADRKLVTVEAGSGDADYANAVRLYLIVERLYDDKHGYELTVVP